MQDLYATETNPNRPSGLKGTNAEGFDASLEEVLHVVTTGYAAAWPEVFGTTSGSQLANAMDKARGGQFDSIPSSYPSSAWYTYNDETCTYDCQCTEYIYWALTSILGGQQYRLGSIQQEWKLNTKDKVRD